MRRRSLGSLAFAVALAGCATTPAPLPDLPTDAERAAAQRAGFELGPVRSASELLPPELVEGPHHRVVDPVGSDGGANLYAIESDFGAFTARGDEQLRERVREIEALAALDAMSGTAEFAKAAGRALASPLVATWNLVAHPVESIRGVPEGAWQRLRDTARLARSERSEFEDSGLASFIGFERVKRRIAAELDVDPYASNPTLQRELNRFAWAAYAGSLPVMFVPFTPEPELPDRASRTEANLLEYSPEDLGRLNRLELAVMGVPGPTADALIDHRWYSPRSETRLVDALAGLDLAANRASFVELAVGAGSEDEALGFVHTAELLRRYNDGVAALREIRTVDGAILGVVDDGTLVAPLPADLASWTPETAALCRAAARARTDAPGDERAALLVSGSVSALTRERAGALGLEITEHALASDPARRSDAAQ